ncbi:MAG: fructose 1,6-bisphosphatase, partial [Dehalococcoidia bacterium]|nr:fructose 1,6-bisphosphatase [Dehalococcoidia bacterium]
MEPTLSVIKADIGGYVGHSCSHPDVVHKANERLESALSQGLLIDYRVAV